MWAVDTNVLVRFLVDDEPQQARKARALFESAAAEGVSVLICAPVFLETLWVLMGVYGISEDEIVEAFNLLQGLGSVEFERESAVGRWLVAARRGAKPIDDLWISLAAQEAGADAIYSFDRKACSSAGMRPLA